MRQYCSFAVSEQGANHKKTDKVCQDASGQKSFDDVHIIAVSDGHGGSDYIRTDRGSRFAVEETLTAFEALVKSCRAAGDSLENNTGQKLWDLQHYILKQWHKRVEEDLLQLPIQETELVKVSDRYKEYYRHEEYQPRAYGATLLAVCVTEDFWMGLQIGDGRCVRIRKNGWIDEPIPWDDHCELNITTSICDGNAGDEFRVAYGRDVPAAVFIGSDGIDDSYCSDEELYELYESIFRVFAENGESDGEHEVREYLPVLTKKGSGDDVSIAGIIDMVPATEVSEGIKERRELVQLNSEIRKTQDEIQAGRDRLRDVEALINRCKAECERLEKETTEISSELQQAEIRLQIQLQRQRELEGKRDDETDLITEIPDDVSGFVE